MVAHGATTPSKLTEKQLSVVQQPAEGQRK